MVEIKKEPKLNDKERMFVKYYATYRDVIKAYLEAGYNPKKSTDNVRVMATLKLQDPRLQEYLKMIDSEEKKYKNKVINHERIVEMLWEDREFARECKSPNASIAATKLLGQSIGMFKNTPEVNNTTVNVNKPLTRDEEEMVKTLTPEKLAKWLELEKKDKDVN